ncbi:MAG: DUF2523 family protein [Porticoccus sp.]|nr:DUF2523 family protein [Porticoccus sp.]
MPLPLVGAAVAGMASLVARYVIPFLVVKMLLALGIGIAVYIGIDTLSDQIVSEVRSSVTGLSGDALAWFSAFGVLDAIEIMLAAHVTGLSIKFAAGGIKRWFIK